MKEETYNPKGLVLAPGVAFDEDSHTYYYHGRQLSGVTRRIGEYRGDAFKPASGDGRMPDVLADATEEGKFVHRRVQDHIVSGRLASGALPATHNLPVVWVISKLLSLEGSFYSEVLVSDFSQYASAVDIIQVLPDGVLNLYDMKRSFNRVKCTDQLSIYKYFIERAGFKVGDMYCLAYKDEEVYPVIDIGAKTVERILYGGGSSRG